MSRIANLFVMICIISVFKICLTLKKPKRQSNLAGAPANCTCGVFLTSQLLRGRVSDKAGDPAITIDIEEEVTCGPLGTNQCSSKCVQELVKFLPTSASIICSSVNRDIHKEKAHLFLKICDQPWTKSKISTAKEICCKDSVGYKCPVV